VLHRKIIIHQIFDILIFLCLNTQVALATLILLPLLMVLQKIKATSSNKGFTLVELIVVITILAILGTIGFISIQGYSAQSRDSKRTSDLRSLASALTLKSTDGILYTSFVTPVNSSTLSGAVGTNLNISGLPMSPTQTDYAAGTPNFTTLGVSTTSFKDGSTDYRIASTTRNGGVFQIAATLESSGTRQALTTGSYSPRPGNMFTASGISSAGSGASSLTHLVTNLSGSGVAYFNRGDVVFLTNAGSGTITSVNGDGRGFTVTLFTASGNSSTSVGLGSVTGGWNEAPGLIASSTSVTTPVVNGSTTALPYTN
jgi:prepilin-type N-terminal cleavage/methylation domain-containing protein